MNDEIPGGQGTGDDIMKMERRLFLQSLGKWSTAAIAATVGGVWLTPKARAAWVNRRGGGGRWVNRAGWLNGGGWMNRAAAGGAWVNRRGGGGRWVNRR